MADFDEVDSVIREFTAEDATIIYGTVMEDSMDEDELLVTVVATGVNQKTATLFSSCCEMGTLSAGNSDKNIILMKEFGTLVGQAFQIRDDLFGYLNHDIGKPSLNDFKQAKMTLPL